MMEIMNAASAAMVIVVPVLLGLGVCGFIADRVLPRIPAVQEFLEEMQR